MKAEYETKDFKWHVIIKLGNFIPYLSMGFMDYGLAVKAAITKSKNQAYEYVAVVDPQEKIIYAVFKEGVDITEDMEE